MSVLKVCAGENISCEENKPISTGFHFSTDRMIFPSNNFVLPASFPRTIQAQKIAEEK